MTSMNTTIGINLQVIGTHYWEQAPAHRAYLAIPHEHAFDFLIEMEVTNDHREVEFHDLRGVVIAILESMYSHTCGIFDFEGRSCESIAKEVGKQLCSDYSRAVQVTVGEDGKCWSRVLVKR